MNRGTFNELYLVPNSNPPVKIALSDAGPIDFSTDAQSLFAVDNASNVIVTVALSNAATMQTVPLPSSVQASGNFNG